MRFLTYIHIIININIDMPLVSATPPWREPYWFEAEFIAAWAPPPALKPFLLHDLPAE